MSEQDCLKSLKVQHLHVIDKSVHNKFEISGDITIDADEIKTKKSTINILNTDTTTINIGGEATEINIAASSGTFTIPNKLSLTSEGAALHLSNSYLTDEFLGRSGFWKNFPIDTAPRSIKGYLYETFENVSATHTSMNPTDRRFIICGTDGTSFSYPGNTDTSVNGSIELKPDPTAGSFQHWCTLQLKHQVFTMTTAGTNVIFGDPIPILWFECRFKITGTTTPASDSSIFIGMAQKLLNNTQDTGDALSRFGFFFSTNVRFRVDWRGYRTPADDGVGGTSYYNLIPAGAGNPVNNTYITLGFKSNTYLTDPYKFDLYVNGVFSSTINVSGDPSLEQFPSFENYAPTAEIKRTSSGPDDISLVIDYIKCAYI